MALSKHQLNIANKVCKSLNGLKLISEILDKNHILDDIKNIIFQFLDNKQDKLTEKTILLGGAGTGKTYTVSNFMNKYSMCKIIVLAPTHKAKKIISTDFKKNMDCSKVRFLTITRYLGISPEYDEDGKLKFSKTVKIDDKNEEYIIFEEMSLINKNYMDYINAFLKTTNKKVLFLGDEMQLPPVNESESISFEDGNKYILTEIKRTSSVELKNVYTHFRNNVINNTRVAIPKNIPSAFYSYTNFKIIRNFKDFKDIFKNYSLRDNVFLAYTNSIVNVYENFIRQELGITTEYETGERLIFNNYMKYSLDSGKYKMFSFNPADTVIITEVTEEYFEGYNVFKINTEDDYILRCVVKNEKTKFENDIINKKIQIKKMFQEVKLKYKKNIITEYNKTIKLSSNTVIKLSKYNNLLFREFVNKVWQEFYFWKNMVNAPLKYDMTSTIHKSQGSSYKDVIIYTKDMYWLSQNDSILYNKLIYTAITRAKFRIFICNFFDEPEYIKTKIDFYKKNNRK